MPYVYGQALVSAGSNSTGIILRGIDPKRGSRTLALNSKMKVGSLQDLDDNADGLPPIILGGELAKQLHVRQGDKVRLIAPTAEVKTNRTAYTQTTAGPVCATHS
jgi:lipoprotein-releasing system permease protein